MKTSYVSYFLIIGLGIVLSLSFSSSPATKKALQPTEVTSIKDSVLRHVVLFKFKSETTTAQLKDIENAFGQLPSKIPEIIDFEWGTNNSPEGLDKGFTHSFFVTFKNEEGRTAYLPHPDHKAFVALASPHIEDVLVVDYWAK